MLIQEKPDIRFVPTYRVRVAVGFLGRQKIGAFRIELPRNLSQSTRVP